MILGELRIVANIDYDDYATFDLTASRAELKIHAHFWDYLDLFEQFGSKLAAFPQNLEDTVEVEIGQLLPRLSQNYLLLSAYCYDANGHAALKIVTCNNESEPQMQRMEFSIPADIAALNKLGNLLKNWSPQENPELVWQAQIS